VFVFVLEEGSFVFKHRVALITLKALRMPFQVFLEQLRRSKTPLALRTLQVSFSFQQVQIAIQLVQTFITILLQVDLLRFAFLLRIALYIDLVLSSTSQLFVTPTSPVVLITSMLKLVLSQMIIILARKILAHVANDGIMNLHVFEERGLVLEYLGANVTLKSVDVCVPSDLMAFDGCSLSRLEITVRAMKHLPTAFVQRYVKLERLFDFKTAITVWALVRIRGRIFVNRHVPFQIRIALEALSTVKAGVRM